MTPDNIEEGVELVQVRGSDLVFQQDKALIDTQIATAKQYPRNITKAVSNIVAIVSMDVKTAEACNYTLKRGTKNISGPSVHLAKIIAQSWGNMRIDAKIVAIEDRQIVSQAVAFDLENNLAIKVEVRRSIMQNEYEYKNGKSIKTGRMIRMNDDMITMTGNAANAIALRNAIFGVIPHVVTEKGYVAAKNVITGDISDEQKMAKAIKNLLDGFKDLYNVTEKEVLAVIGKAAVQHITADDIVMLKGIAQAIKDGDTTAELSFKQDAQKEESKAATKKKIEDAIVDVPAKIKACKTIAELDAVFDSTTDADSYLEDFKAKRAELKK